MDVNDVASEVAALASELRARGARLATAESCTGGLIAACCTALAGSSDWFERGFVTYSNAAKVEMLGVPEALIADHGAVSEAVARAMAEGALRRSAADLALAVTGVAGPSGGTTDKPVGLVWMGRAMKSAAEEFEVCTYRYVFSGDRRAVRLHTVRAALIRGIAALQQQERE